MSVNIVVHPFSTSALGQNSERSWSQSLCLRPMDRYDKYALHFARSIPPTIEIGPELQTHRFERERRPSLLAIVSRGPSACGEKNARHRVGNKQQCRGASGKPVNVVPVLRPVTDCRLSDRLRPDQTQGNGSREDRAGLRPPGKKGAEPAGRNPGRSCCRP